MKALKRNLYTTKEVAQLLGIEDPRRVKNYSDIEDYGIRPIHVGSGQGSRKLYSWLNIIQIAVAEELSRCGFTPHTIGIAIKRIKPIKELHTELYESIKA